MYVLSKTIIPGEKKSFKMLYRFKTTFPKEFFNDIWLKVAEHEQICVSEITLFKNYYISEWRQKQFFDIVQ